MFTLTNILVWVKSWGWFCSNLVSPSPGPIFFVTFGQPSFSSLLYLCTPSSFVPYVKSCLLDSLISSFFIIRKKTRYFAINSNCMQFAKRKLLGYCMAAYFYTYVYSFTYLVRISFCMISVGLFHSPIIINYSYKRKIVIGQFRSLEKNHSHAY